MEAAECGAAALAIVFAYHRLFIPLERLREECGVSRDGTNAARLLVVARQYGFRAAGYCKEPDELTKLPLPAIIHWNFDHFVVLEGLNRRKAWINDPARGRRRVGREEFDRCFTGPVLVLTPGADFRTSGVPPRVIPILLEWVRGARFAVAFIALIGLLLVIPGLIVPALSRLFVDHVLTSGNNHLVGPLIVGLLFTALCRGLLTWLHRDTLSRLSFHLVKDLSSKYLWHAMRLPLSFYLARHPGDIASRVEIGDRLSWLLSGDLPSMVLSALMVVFFAFMMFWFDPYLTLIVLFVAIASLAIDRMGSSLRAEKASQATHEQALWLGLSISGLQTIETLKANGIESRFFEKWSGQQARVARTQQSFALFSECISAPTRYLHSIGTLVVLGVGARNVLREEMTIGTLVAFQSLMMSFLGPISDLANFAGQVDEIRAQVARFRDVLDHPVDEVSAAETMVPSAGIESRASMSVVPADVALKGHIEFRNITFGYNPLRPPCVTDLSFSIFPGSRVAIVGRTGSGKSTIARLLTGLLAPWSGELLLDARPRSSLSHRSLTAAIASVEQDIHLFEGTIAENLTLWDSSIPHEALKRAIHDACLDEVIARLPLGLETRLTEGGRNFSGGERQRLEIARALVRDPAILVLDEATSALDAETERKFYERVRQRGYTCITVAHRLSAVRDSDEILVLDAGRIAERGRHEDLWRRNGSYRQLILAE